MLSLSVFSASLPLSFVRFCSASGYSALCFFLSVLPVSSFPFFPFLPHSGFLGAASPLSLPCFPRSFLPDFSCILSRFPYLAFCWFPFVLPCFAPAAVPQVIPFWISPPGPVLDFRLSFVRFRFSASLLGLCFFLSSFFPFPPHSGFLGATLPLTLPWPFPVLPSLVSHALFPGSSYSASCSFPFILPGFAPTAVPPVLPFVSAFASLRGFPPAFRFLSIPSACF